MEEKQTNQEKKQIEKNVVYIGDKMLMNYVTSAIIQITTYNQDEIKIRARGKFITKAVDVTEIVRKRFLKDKIALKDIKINSEDFKDKDGKERRVSTIEITLKKV